MNIKTEQIVSITDANQNFSRIARLADKEGTVYIFKNNKAKYKLVNLEDNFELELTHEEQVDIVAKRILVKYKEAFEELAK